MTKPEIIPTPLADYYIDCLKPVKKSNWKRFKDWILRRDSWKNDEEESDFAKFLKESHDEREVRKKYGRKQF